MKKTLLLIKTGHAETFTEDVSSDVCSLGDVFRTILLIPLLKEFKLTWLTDERAVPLIDDLSGVTINTVEGGDRYFQSFDYILNLEKSDDFLELSTKNNNTFGFISLNNEIHVRPLKCPSSESVAFEDFLSGKEKTYCEKILEIIGHKIDVIDYPLLEVNNTEVYDIGLNWKVGPKWPEKSIEMDFWINLENELSPHFSISWQKGFNDLAEYKKWIASCKTIVTLDSLGLHLSLAFRKHVVALFGPTDASEIDLYGRGKKFSYKDSREKSRLVKSISSYLTS